MGESKQNCCRWMIKHFKEGMCGHNQGLIISSERGKMDGWMDGFAGNYSQYSAVEAGECGSCQNQMLHVSSLIITDHKARMRLRMSL